MIPDAPVLRRRIVMVMALLFLLPFCGVGLFLATLAWEEFDGGEIEKALVLSAASLAFAGAGFGLLAALIVRTRRQKGIDRQKALHPQEPWLWRDDWAAGRVRLSSASGVAGLWAFAVLWNLIAFPFLLFLPAEVFDRGNTAAALGFLFPLIGIPLLVAAARASVARAIHGRSTFHLETIPGLVGGSLEGKVCMEGSLQPADGFTLRLSCLRRTRTGSGKNRSTTESVEWQDEQRGVLPVPRADAPGSAIPVRFQIPYECLPHTADDGGTGILWRLEARGSVPGVDYAAAFEVPVFKTDRSSPELTEDRLRAEAPGRDGDLPVRPAEAGVIVRPSEQGGTEFVVLPGRNMKAGLLMGLFVLVWTAILWVLIAAGAPVLMALVFGFFDLLLLYVVLQLLFAEYRIIVEGGTVAVRQTIFGIMTGTRIPCAEIASVRVKIGGQSGSGVLRSLVLVRKDGREVKAGGLLGSKPLADWLATEVQRSISAWHRTP
jgi:hypothetical protein